MSEGKHTPGPWKQSHRKQPNGDYITQVYCAGGETIANVAWYPVELGDGITGTSRGANARLIAAAPDLLEALQQSINQMQMAGDAIENGRYDEALLHVRSLMRSKLDAIAKATRPQGERDV